MAGGEKFKPAAINKMNEMSSCLNLADLNSPLQAKVFDSGDQQ